MACYINENVYTHTFTPREYQVELLDSAKKRNTIICSSTGSAKAFIIIKLLQEFSYEMRKENGKQALFLLDVKNVPVMTSHVKLLTDLTVISIINNPLDIDNDPNVGNNHDNALSLKNHNVVITTAEICVTMCRHSLIDLINDYNLIVIDCLYGYKEYKYIEEIMSIYRSVTIEKPPRILGLTSGILSNDMKPERLEAELQRLEKLLNSHVDTSSEILTLIRLSCRPRERIIECAKNIQSSLHERLKYLIQQAKDFLCDHRYDLSEIYDDELLKEFKQLPDPKEQPLNLFDEFLEILEDLGPWAADRVAYGMLIKIEKLKVKVPYERHYLLLCMTSTVFVTIRAECDYEFQNLTDKERIFNFSTPKVLRFLEVIKQFKPAINKPEMTEKISDNNRNKNLDISNNNNNNNSTNKKFKGKNFKNHRRTPYMIRNQTDDLLCALVFVKNRYKAEALFTLLCIMSKNDEEYWWVSVSFTVNKIADPVREPKEAESEHKRQEEVLRRYRSHECNIMIATAALEQGCDLPKCNLVIRFDLPQSFQSYIYSKARARANESHFLLFVNEDEITKFVNILATYNEVENTLLKRCYSLEPDKNEEFQADSFSILCKPYRPLSDNGNYVTLSNAIALINRYCAKLPSDTFTRLTPIWYETKTDNGYICTISLPINSPVKKQITSPPMMNMLLARRAAAFILCQLLHKAGELDDNLQPISKENFKTNDEYDWNISLLDNEDNDDEDDNINNTVNNNNDYIKNRISIDNDIDENLEPRPGTTKRRQYYYKKIADALLNCHPISNEPVYFYKIVMKLTCPLPEEQNTRGRKIYPPEESPQGFGILTSKEIPKISAFPIFTRSGEVSVELELCSKIILNALQILKIREFVNYTFTSVLRLQKYLTLFNPDTSANSYLIVPTIEDSNNNQILIDWDFIDLIFDNLNVLPEIVPEQVRKNYTFDIEKYRDAVVMPWYRNQDQPQYFYVAEICTNLNPSSDFPGSDYATFEEYYYKKYSIRIQNKEQYLLDVDHTSARLNFLTPRYVNRKGVALPTSSEATKRAKREKLEQKQILVPELCAIHPFTASLWRKAVCLPCILYRINALLLADQIRRTVAIELKLGKLELDPDFKWPPLNFGWSLADVLKKSKEEKKIEKKIDQIDEHENKTNNDDAEELKNNNKDETNNNIDDPEMIEIGTWSNDMATLNNNGNNNEYTVIRYASPTNWLNINNSHDNIDDDDEDDDDNNNNHHNHNNTDDDIDIVDDDDLFSDLSCSDDESDLEWGGLRIEFTGDNIAEALDDDQQNDDNFKLVDYSSLWRIDDDDDDDHDYNKDDDTFNNKHDDVGGSADDDKNLSEKLKNEFLYNCQKNYQHILSSGILVKKSECFIKYTENDTYFNRELDMISTNFDFNQLFIDTNINELLSNSKNYTNLHSNNNINIILDNDVDDDAVFKFDQQPDLDQHPGPSPNVLLQALTMSNANDGINLERLETIGDSFLKYAITNYLYSKYENVHEGKLSHLRSKQVSNLNLYRLGKKKGLGEFMIATKFDPHDNWLPPCFYVPKELEEALIDAHFPANCWTISDMAATRDMSIDEICTMVRERGDVNLLATVATTPATSTTTTLNNTIPYNLVTQHSIPDKSIADCVEALIGAYLIECGPRGALLFMAWLGINVLPKLDNGSYGQVKLPKSPLACNCDYERNKDGGNDDNDNNDNSNNNLINIRLNILLDGYDKFEMHIGYKFRDRSYLLQALTHASYTPNTLTDCYQRLEFLGDAVLDYLITRHLYEDKRMHSPGALTDLRSALVNNTIFASLAVRNGFHRYFRNLSPTLNEVIEKFVRLQEDNGHTLVDELYLVVDVETDEVEDVEVPKALGDVFESVAGAIFLDSGMSLDAVWKVYYNMMKNEIEQFSNKVPKSPIRELLELEPETAKFGKPEKLADGRRVRVTVEVFGKGVFKGIGRNYRIAKCTAAKCALKNLKKRGLIKKSDDK